jgi:hypothetical protein
MVRDAMSTAELVEFLRIHTDIEVVPCGVQGGLFGGDVQMVRVVVGKIGVMVSVEQLDCARTALYDEGVMVKAQASLIAGVDWNPV